MERSPTLLILFLASFAAGAGFEPTSLRSFERNRPAPEEIDGLKVDTSRPGLLLRVSQTCEVRQIPAARKTFLQQLGTTFGRPDVFALYSRELRVEQLGLSRWVPFQDETLDHFLESSCGIGEVAIKVRYLGTHPEAGRVYLGIGYTHELPASPAKATCFADALLGIRIGAPLTSTRATLKQRYGSEFEIPVTGGRRLWGYPVDSERETTLIVGDGGSHQRDSVFSIQVWGDPNPKLPLALNMKLGDSADSIGRVLPPTVSTRTSKDGFELWTFADSPCSVETRKGVLASVLIVGDPHDSGSTSGKSDDRRPN